MTILDGFIQLLTMAYDGSLSSQTFSNGILVGDWAIPLEHISQLGWWQSQYMEKNLPNHQPVFVWFWHVLIQSLISILHRIEHPIHRIKVRDAGGSLWLPYDFRDWYWVHHFRFSPLKANSSTLSATSGLHPVPTSIIVQKQICRRQGLLNLVRFWTQHLSILKQNCKILQTWKKDKNTPCYARPFSTLYDFWICLAWSICNPLGVNGHSDGVRASVRCLQTLINFGTRCWNPVALDVLLLYWILCSSASASSASKNCRCRRLSMPFAWSYKSAIGHWPSAKAAPQPENTKKTYVKTWYINNIQQSTIKHQPWFQSSGISGHWPFRQQMSSDAFLLALLAHTGESLFLMPFPTMTGVGPTGSGAFAFT